MKRNITHIILHHTGTPDDDFADDWKTICKNHVEKKGWRFPGYDFALEKEQGKVVVRVGRPMTERGAHCDVHDFNARSVGVCMIGNYSERVPDAEMLFRTIDVITGLSMVFNVSPKNVVGHGEVDATECPGKNIDMDFIREMVMKKRLATMKRSDNMGTNKNTVNQENIRVTVKPWWMKFAWWSNSAVVTMYPNIYVPSGWQIDDITLAHEMVHCKQQKESDSIIGWYAKYALSKNFRKKVELEAYDESVRMWIKNKKWNDERKQNLIDDLSGSLYWKMMSRKEAEEWVSEIETKYINR